ncbi:hypothetical protein RHSIM_Rhsim06G0038300 [Rhododendron simsii]|uniref:Uncharacterized protein n=1 Tax=Rhododendron simsii TaxID=118357 RepID=A0A834GY66_RHOSS|nr:hypothetical protein RHSIM_Rhsim06G0038300 [Rhododendron simsii]
MGSFKDKHRKHQLLRRQPLVQCGRGRRETKLSTHPKLQELNHKNKGAHTTRALMADRALIQFLKFRVCRQFGLRPAAAVLDEWLTPKQLMFAMLTLEGTYMDSSTILSPILSYHPSHSVTQGILRITSINTYRTLQNVNGVDGGNPNDQKTDEIGSPDKMWGYIAHIISKGEGEPVLEELTAVKTQFLNHTRQRGRKQYLEIHNTYDLGGAAGMVKVELILVVSLRQELTGDWRGRLDEIRVVEEAALKK